MEEAEKNADIEEVQKVLTPLPRAWEGQKPANAWPEETRIAAVNLAVELKSIKQAATRLNIPVKTLTAWMAEAMAIDLDAWNMAAVKEIEDKIDQVLARIGPDKIEAANLRDLAVTAGILLDKRQGLVAKTKTDANPRVHLRVAWKDGAGAVELTESRE